MILAVRNVGSLWRHQSFIKRLCSQLQPVQMAFNVFENSDTDGSLPPVIIMHGLYGSKRNWRGIGNALLPKLKRRIFTVDTRNHGDSPHTAAHGTEHVAADIVEFMRQRGIAKSSVIGHSMGGFSMMFLALKYPEYVERGIIVDISPVADSLDVSEFEYIFSAMKLVSVPPEMSLANGRALAAQQIKDAINHRGTVQFIMLNLKKRETGEFFWTLNLDALQNNIIHVTNFMHQIAGFPPFQGPMMFICGDKSNFFK